MLVAEIAVKKLPCYPEPMEEIELQPRSGEM
jgi:hypothetical protein